jgi:hypothetical protein
MSIENQLLELQIELMKKEIDKFMEFKKEVNVSYFPETGEYDQNGKPLTKEAFWEMYENWKNENKRN